MRFLLAIALGFSATVFASKSPHCPAGMDLLGRGFKATALAGVYQFDHIVVVIPQHGPPHILYEAMAMLGDRVVPVAQSPTASRVESSSTHMVVPLRDDTGALHYFEEAPIHIQATYGKDWKIDSAVTVPYVHHRYAGTVTRLRFFDGVRYWTVSSELLDEGRIVEMEDPRNRSVADWLSEMKIPRPTAVTPIRQLDIRRRAELALQMGEGGESPYWFLGGGDSLTDTVDSDANHDHVALGEKLFAAQAALAQSQFSTARITIDGARLKVTGKQMRGVHWCPFEDEVGSNIAEMVVENLDSGAVVKTRGISAHNIRVYGFYDGRGSEWRVEPAAITAAFAPVGN